MARAQRRRAPRGHRSPSAGLRHPPRVHEGIWDAKAKIIRAEQLKDHDFKLPVVIACATTEEYATARQYYAARGSPIGATFVNLGGTGDKVMVTGPTGPRLAAAIVKAEGVDAPKRRGLPKGIADDHSHAAEGGETAYLRITIAKALCVREVYKRAKARPQCLPALVIKPGLIGKVLATRVAIAYEEETTCLILVHKADMDRLLGASQLCGAFIMTHKEQAAPGWILRKDKEVDDVYHQRTTAAAARSGGRLIYRLGARSALGVLGAECGVEGALQPTWYVHGTPLTWGDDQLNKLVKERGFITPTENARCGKQAWTFRAAAPRDAGEVTTFAFTSGITIGLSAALRRKNAEHILEPKPRWGVAMLPADQVLPKVDGIEPEVVTMDLLSGLTPPRCPGSLCSAAHC